MCASRRSCTFQAPWTCLSAELAAESLDLQHVFPPSAHSEFSCPSLLKGVFCSSPITNSETSHWYSLLCGPRAKFTGNRIQWSAHTWFREKFLAWRHDRCESTFSLLSLGQWHQTSPAVEACPICNKLSPPRHTPACWISSGMFFFSNFGGGRPED